MLFGILRKLLILYGDYLRKIRYKIKPPVKYYLIKYHQLMDANNEIEGQRVLLQGMRLYPDNKKLTLEVGKHYSKKGNYKKSLEYYKSLYEGNKLDNEKEMLSYLKALIKSKELLSFKDIYITEKLANKSLVSSGKLVEISKDIFECYIDIQRWEDAKRVYKLFETYEENLEDNIIIKRAMIYQLEGQINEANNIYSRLFQEQSEEFTKIVIFSNGESSIEFYKKHQLNDEVMCTFDSINITWNDDPFAYGFLSKYNLDIVALRRRRDDSYHQDLNAKEYRTVVNKLLSFYKRKMAYGFSLGGYTSLYYGSVVNAEILSISPRNSTHPLFGIQPETKELFQHEIRLEIFRDLKPTIFYDPKNRVDNKYVNLELMNKFPKANFITIPYSGHRILPFMHEIGQLKNVVTDFIHSKELTMNFSAKVKRDSFQYLKRLADACYKKGKFNWARDISIMALEKNRLDKRVLQIYISSLIKLGMYKTVSEIELDEIISYEYNWLNYIKNLTEIKLIGSSELEDEEINKLINNVLID